MKNPAQLKNTIQEYAWGSYTAIPDILGTQSPAEKPQAELWVGAHPKAPSIVLTQEGAVPFDQLIKKNPVDILGTYTAKKFDEQLPYLLKILAAEKALSIQAHPSQENARAGFERENKNNISLTAPHRNYKDPFHKPELICAISSFWALNGFTSIANINENFSRISNIGLESALNNLSKKNESEALQGFFLSILGIAKDEQSRVIQRAVDKIKKIKAKRSEEEWVLNLYDQFPDDIGILSPYFLNLVCLKPGQALFLEAGVMHAYLNGVGIELMANSDNVLRGGLTPKHIDMQELNDNLQFKSHPVKILEKKPIHVNEFQYDSQAEEFVLKEISIAHPHIYESQPERQIEILLCINGTAELNVPEEKVNLEIKGGTAIVIPAATSQYEIKGNAVIYKASVNN